MRTFGSAAYVHVPKEKMKKLNRKSIRMIFVGYADGRKAYRFLDPETDTVLISRDAKFIEEFSGHESIREVIPVSQVPVSDPEDRKTIPAKNMVKIEVNRAPIVAAEIEAVEATQMMEARTKQNLRSSTQRMRCKNRILKGFSGDRCGLRKRRHPSD